MTRTLISSLAIATALGLGACSKGETVTSAPEAKQETKTATEDPYLWLEEVEGEDALNWVRTQNERSLEHLEANPVYEQLKAEALEIVNSKERIPYGSIRDGEVYNFWQDETNVRGLWRKTSLESYGYRNPGLGNHCRLRQALCR